jgi:hypothetical protein
MAKVRTIQNSFNAGEWSPLMNGRVDLEKYSRALARMENCVIDPRGPAVFRPGLRRIAETKTSASVSVLIPFEFSAAVAYALEFGDLYVRFYRNKTQVLSGGIPVEVVTPYAAADLAELKYVQSADVVYLFHPDYATRKLSRTSDTSWVLSQVNFNPPPSYEAPLYPNTTLTLGAVTGTSITFTAGSSVFLSGDEGRLIISGAGRASITGFTSGTVVTCDIIDDFASVGPIAADSWSLQGSPVGTLKPSVAFPVGGICTLTSQAVSTTTNLLDADGDHWTSSPAAPNEFYLDNSAPFYSLTKPTKVFINNIERAEGTVGTLGLSSWDFGDNDTLGYDTIYVRLGDNSDPDTKAAADETYVKKQDDVAAKDVFRSTDVGKFVRILSGFVKITSYNSATVVKGEILKELSDNTETANWTLESEMWDATNGFPSVGVFFENRLIVAGSPSFPETVWGSVSGDFENFTPGVDDADSIQFSLASRQINIIRWIEPRDYLIIGCIGGEWRVGPEDSGAPLTPTNVTAKQQRTNGCANILPVTVDRSTLFLQRSSRKIREFTFEFTNDGYEAPDLTLLAEHISEGGIIAMAYQQDPLSILWCVRNDGKLIGMTYLRDQDVVGWHIHETDGSVESIITIPGDGYDEVWAIVNRTINGSTVRNVEMLEAFFSDDSATFKTNKGLNAFFVDSGTTYNGAATTTITGLSHLEGEAVNVLADGSVIEGKTVSGGKITLSIAASIVHVGLPYTGLLEQLRFNASLQDGTAQGQKKRIHRFIVRANESGPFKAGADENNLLPVTGTTTGGSSGGLLGMILGAVPDLFTGDLQVDNNEDWNREGSLTVVQDKPLPMTILAIVPEVAT